MSNTWSGIVRSGRDAEVRQAGSSSVMSVTAANNTGFGDRQKTLWLRLNYWGKGGEAVAQFIKKGSQFYVTGELSQSEYQDKQSGETKQSLELNVTSIDLVGSKSDNQNGQQEPAQQHQNGQPTPQAKPAYQNGQPEQGGADYLDDSIPF